MRGKEIVGILGFISLIYIILPKSLFIPKSRTDILLFQWKQCMLDQMNPIKGDHNTLWSLFPDFVKNCESKVSREFNISRLVNKDETKFHIFNRDNIVATRVLTLGVGHDVDSEVKLKNHLQGNAELFGADPIVDVNEALFSKIGSFFPFAVGANAGMGEASILATDNKYVMKTVVYVDFIYFLKKIVKKNSFDALWLDAEGAEYDLMPMFYRHGDLDNNDVTFCQMNMEVHLPNDEKKSKVHDFFFRLIEDQRYAIVSAHPIGHMRLYMINMSDEECLSRFKGHV